MSVEVSEEMVDVFGGGGISVPFPNVESEKRFIGVCPRLLDEVFEVAGKVMDKVLVEVLSEKVCY
jgi:hypothetical protein